LDPLTTHGPLSYGRVWIKNNQLCYLIRVEHKICLNGTNFSEKCQNLFRYTSFFESLPISEGVSLISEKMWRIILIRAFRKTTLAVEKNVSLNGRLLADLPT
jgi:hypothetical protein